MATYSPRDRSRTAGSKTEKMRDNFRKPPKDEIWIWITEGMILSPAFTSLSVNAGKAFWRIIVEYLKTGRKENGNLIVTYPNFRDYGVTWSFIGDAIDELVYKGLVRVKRGRAGDGTAHPNLYCLTFVGDHEGCAPSNDWKGISQEDADRWPEVRGKRAAERSKRAGRKRKSSLHEHGIARSMNMESALASIEKAS
jgi:hypothetical protein